MAAFTSKAAGNWSASGQTTWNEVGVPGNGDTVTMTHAVAVDTNTIVGTSPSDSTTYVITLNAGGVLTVNDGVTFTVRGNVSCAAATAPAIKVGTGSTGGSQWIFDPTQASTRTAAAYKINFVSGSYAEITGVSGNKAVFKTLRTNGDEAQAFTVGVSGNYGIRKAYFCDFSDIGNSSTTGISNTMASAGLNSDIQDCTFTRCGTVFVSANGNGTGTVQFLRCKFTSTNASSNKAIDMRFNNAKTTGTRAIIGCDFDYTPTVTSPTNMTLQYNTIRTSSSTLNAAASTTWDLFDSNVVRGATSSTYFTAIGSMSNCYLVADYTGTNPHHLNLSGTYTSGVTLDGLIFHAPGATLGDGDCILTPTPPTAGTAITHTVKRCMTLPGSSNYGPGCLLTHFANSGTCSKFSFEHNTIFTGGINGLNVGENGSSAPLTITGCANNGSGLIRVTVSGTFYGPTGTPVRITGVTGTTEANATWASVTRVSSTQFDLAGSTFTNAYVSGGSAYIGYPADTLASYKANICWDYQIGGPSGVATVDFHMGEADTSWKGTGDPTLNYGSAANLDYNGSYLIHTDTPAVLTGLTYTNTGRGYAMSSYSSTPGSHDQVATNPQFVDTTRNIQTYGSSVLGLTSPTVSQVLDAMWSATGSLATQIPAMLAWVRNGFAIQSTSYRGASYPGDPMTVDANGNPWPTATPDIGAMAFAGATDPVFPNMSMSCTMP